MKTSRFNFFT